MYAIIITVIMDIIILSIRVRAAVCSIAPASLTVSGLQLVASPLKKNPQHVEESLSSPRTVVICLCYIYQKLTNSTKHSVTQAPTGSSYKRSSSSSFSRWMSAAQQYNAFVRFPGKDAQQSRTPEFQLHFQQQQLRHHHHFNAVQTLYPSRSAVVSAPFSGLRIKIISNTLITEYMYM